MGRSLCAAGLHCIRHHGPYAARPAGGGACSGWVWHPPYDGLFAHSMGLRGQNLSYYAYLYGHGCSALPCSVACKTKRETVRECLPEKFSGRHSCLERGLVYHGSGAADAHHGACKFLPGIAAADAVCSEADRALEGLEGCLCIIAENAVQRAGGISKCILSVSITTTGL